jgi:hypothetical protein
MIYIEDEKVDLLMTPNHRIPFRFSGADFPLLHNEVLTLTASEIHQLHRLVNRNKKSFPLRFIHPEEDIRITEDWSCKEVDYDGMVYCVTVPSDAIVVRRKGKVTVTRQSQNFPKAMRSMIVAQPGNVLVGADMDQLELRVAAARWGVELYLRAFREGKDPHGMTAYAVFGNDFCRAAGVDPSCYAGNGMLVGKAYDEKGKFIGKGEAKTFRDLSKGVQYCSQYMGSAETTHKLIRKTEVPASDPVTKEPLNDGTTDLPYAKLPLQKVRVMQENWLRGAPQFKTGWQAEIETYRKKGYLREPVTGRRRDFLDGEKANEIVNFPIQCVPGNVRVITKNGYIPIRELEGLRFDAWTGKKWATATCIRKGTVPLLRVNTNHAASLLCDATHKFRVVGRSEYEWREADSLIENNRVAMTLATDLNFGKDIGDDVAFLLGLYTSDGCLSRKDKGKNEGVAFSIVVGKTSSTGRTERSGIEAKENVERLMSGVGLSPTVREEAGHWVVLAGRDCDVFCSLFGLNPGLKARDKRIPEIIWRSSLANRKKFLLGVLDGDGYQLPDGAVVLNMFNPDLLREIAVLCRTVGIDAQKLAGPYRTNKESETVSWRLMLSGSQVFSSLGWGRECKYRSNETLPSFEVRRVVEKLSAKSASQRTMKSRLRNSDNDKSITAYSCAKMEVNDIYDHAHVSSVSSLCVRSEVFTLCVDDEEHCYVAEGFISKNSSAAAIMNLAMVKLYEQVPLHKWGPGTGIINQCHDAIVIECPEGEGERVARLLEECMNQVHDSLPGVEFTASADIGKSWDKV